MTSADTGREPLTERASSAAAGRVPAVRRARLSDRLSERQIGILFILPFLAAALAFKVYPVVQ